PAPAAYGGMAPRMGDAAPRRTWVCLLSDLSLHPPARLRHRIRGLPALSRLLSESVGWLPKFCNPVHQSQLLVSRSEHPAVCAPPAGAVLPGPDLLCAAAEQRAVDAALSLRPERVLSAASHSVGD